MHRRVWGFLLFLPLLLATALWQSNIKTDISAFFFTGGSAETAIIASNMQTGELSRRYILSIGQTSSSNTPPEITDELRSSLSEVAEIKRVWGPSMDENEINELISFYLPYRSHLFSLQPEIEVTSLFSKTSLHQRAESIKQGLLSPEAPIVKKIIHNDPMFLLSNWLQHYHSNKKEESRYSTLIVETTPSGLNTRVQKTIKKSIEATFEALNSAYAHRYTLEMTGIPLFAMAVQKQVSKDVMLVSSISTVAMLLLFMLLFRSLRALIIVSLTLIASAAVASIVTSIFFGEIHALTLALGTTLIGICVDYPIHTMVHAAADRKPPIAAAKRIWPSLLLGAITTIIGYTALSFTGYPGMQQIALYAGCGILTSLTLSRFILPYALALKTERTRQPSFNFSRWLVISRKLNIKLPLLFLTSTLLLIGLANLHWSDDLSRLSPSLSEIKQQDQQIRSRIESIEPGRFILLHADTMEHALQTNEAVLLKLEALKTVGKLEAYFSIYPWLASEQLQQRNNHAFSAQLTPAHIKLWRKALEESGLRPSMLSNAAISTLPPLTMEKLLDSPVGRYIAGQHTISADKTILTIWLGKHNQSALKKMLAALPNAEYVSQKDMINEINADYGNKTIKALAYGSLIILLLLTLRYRSPAHALHALAPAILSCAIVIGCWGISGLPFGMLHLLGMLLSVAICVDYGIFFIENRALDMKVTYQAIVLSALTTIIAFTSLGAAENPALQTLAWTIAPGVFFGFLLCPLLIRLKIDNLPR
ncbi:MAG: MMPL family transporter [Mariprofundus sp.]|nr:MMPL family transporter [Mariprofundus sp.]